MFSSLALFLSSGVFAEESGTFDVRVKAHVQDVDAANNMKEAKSFRYAETDIDVANNMKEAYDSEDDSDSDSSDSDDDDDDKPMCPSERRYATHKTIYLTNLEGQEKPVIKHVCCQKKPQKRRCPPPAEFDIMPLEHQNYRAKKPRGPTMNAENIFIGPNVNTKAPLNIRGIIRTNRVVLGDHTEPDGAKCNEGRECASKCCSGKDKECRPKSVCEKEAADAIVERKKKLDAEAKEKLENDRRAQKTSEELADKKKRRLLEWKKTAKERKRCTLEFPFAFHGGKDCCDDKLSPDQNTCTSEQVPCEKAPCMDYDVEVSSTCNKLPQHYVEEKRFLVFRKGSIRKTAKEMCFLDVETDSVKAREVCHKDYKYAHENQDGESTQYVCCNTKISTKSVGTSNCPVGEFEECTYQGKGGCRNFPSKVCELNIELDVDETCICGLTLCKPEHNECDPTANDGVGMCISDHDDDSDDSDEVEENGEKKP